MVGGQRHLGEGLTREDDQAHAVAGTVLHEVGGHVLGGRQTVRLEVAGQHGARDVHGHDDVDAFDVGGRVGRRALRTGDSHDEQSQGRHLQCEKDMSEIGLPRLGQLGEAFQVGEGQRRLLFLMEQRLYMKGDNLVKAMLYAIAYFYRLVDGDKMSVERINYKRLLNQKVEPKLFQQIVEEVKGMDNPGFFNFLNLIKQINNVRYKNLDNLYLNYFVASCGVYEVFALENPAYLMLLVTSANYKTKLSNYGLNRMLSMPCKKIITLMTGMV